MPGTQNTDLAAIQARLQAMPALAGVDVLIYEAGDILSEITTAVAKTTGLCVVLVSNGLRRPQKLAGSRWELAVQLDLWVAPVLQQDGSPQQQPVNDLVEAILADLDGWRPDTAPSCWEWVATRAVPRTELGMLVWGIELVADRSPDLTR